jgi:hypothetical protein
VTIMSNPTKAGMKVAAIHGRKVSLNPIMASVSGRSQIELKGFWAGYIFEYQM